MEGPKTIAAAVALAVMTAGGYYVVQNYVGSVTPENAKGVLYVYTRSGCKACRMAKPIVDRLKKEGFKIKVIDVERSPEKAGKAGVAFLPTFIHYANGKETQRIKGTAAEWELRGMFRP